MTRQDVPYGHLVVPDVVPAPALVLIHDVWGLSDHQRDLAGRLARAGFVTLAVDLYRAMDGVSITDPGAWMRRLSDPAILADLQSTVDALAARPDVSGKVGILGFCMGGSYALMAGAELRGVSGVASFYGVLSHEHGLLFDPAGLDPEKKPRQPLDAAPKLRCPMIGFFGAEDPYVPMRDVRALEGALAASGQPYAVHVYEGAGHAFVNDTRPGAYREADAKDAWGKMVAFFTERLGG